MQSDSSSKPVASPPTVQVVSATRQDFNGRRYFRYDGEKRYFQRVTRIAERYLHRTVWAYHNGPIPEGSHVHHKDGNRANNQIDNLELLTPKAHLAVHESKDREGRKLARLNSLELARDAAKDWHASAEGRAWHRSHYERTVALLHVKDKPSVCQQCNQPFLSEKLDALFCSNNCASAHRRASGVDNETRICANPGCCKHFVVNRYQKKICCDRLCASKVIWDRRRANANQPSMA
jgi:hypothetical protein